MTAFGGGLRLALIVGALSAPAAPAFALSRSFVCTFDPGSDAIDARCERVLSGYVEFWTQLRDGRLRAWPGPGFAPAYSITRIEVGGHADGAEVSRGLAVVSERRARAVAEWLIAAGIPREYVIVTGYGARQLIVPTQPHEAEPLNRRVDVISR
ncbi:OmpA family protein [Roseomonas sp. CAU 1739]|uniref:OmpA family protein n=1 Tax=Roseomonas sp. CAU 1739 TaxID=3140364 RepID=UPI00325B66D4